MSINTRPSDGLVPDEWTTRLADAIAASLREVAPRLRGTAVIVLQMTCLPWHGLLGLAILTDEEIAEDPSLANPMRTMEWRYGEFSEEVEAWRQTTPLAQAMRAAYTNSPDLPAAAIEFLKACARALASTTVAEAMSVLECADGFRITVPHPDDRREFFPATT